MSRIRAKLSGANYRRRTLAAWMLMAAMGGCIGNDPEEVELATRCIRASDDNRVKLSASMLSDADIEVSEDHVVVRARVPVGISLSAKLKFRHWTYTCRRDGEHLIFIGYETRGP